MAIDKFSRLIEVIQLKSNNANDEERRMAHKSNVGNSNDVARRMAGNANAGNSNNEARRMAQNSNVGNSNDEARRMAGKSNLEGQRRAGGANDEAGRGQSSNPESLTKAEQQRALTELQVRLRALRQTLSPAAADQLDQWLEWASQHR